MPKGQGQDQKPTVDYSKTDFRNAKLEYKQPEQNLQMSRRNFFAQLKNLAISMYSNVKF
jgi:hypothetical protein